MAAPERRVIWSADALADLDGIWTYYVQVAGRNTADKIIRQIGQAVRVLEEHPFAGRARNDIHPDLRSVVARPHVIFYRVKNDSTEIARVLDGRQDLEEIFSR
jgi:toxin ParE1/3/4